MPEDPKNIFRRARKKQELDAAEAAARKEREANQKRTDRQRERRARQPEEGAPESEAAQWVRDNFEWEPYPSLWVPKFASWSDYSGSYVDRANGKALIRDHADLFEEGHGGHGTVWVGIAEDKRLAMTDEQWEAIKDVIEALEDYPVIDDELHSQMEMEAKYEYWEEYGREGVREFLTKKFNTVGDVDASIAVVARRNEFWDTMMRENDWDQHLNEEEGGNFYFDEKHALADVTRDDIVDEDMVESTKKQVFFKSWAGGQASFANQLEKALQQAGVDVENGHHLWQLVKYAEHVLGPVGVWEVSDRFHSSKAEVDIEDQISLASVEDVVNVLSAPDAHQKMLHKHWAEDPRQLKLPDFESKSGDAELIDRQGQALVAALLEAESPKQVMQQLPRFKFKIASPGEQVMLQAEEGGDWPIPLGIVIQDPDRKFRICSGSPTRLGWKWWENVEPDVFALQFGAKDDAAKHLWLIWKRSGQLREAEDPKRVLRSLPPRLRSGQNVKLNKPGHPAHGQLMTLNVLTPGSKALCANRWYHACVEPNELEPYGESEDPKRVFRSIVAAAPHYVIAGLSRRGFNVYYSQSGWSDELKKAKRYSKEAALEKMMGDLRYAYPGVTHRAIMRVGVVKPTPGSPTVANEAEDPKAALRQAQTANPWGPKMGQTGRISGIEQPGWAWVEIDKPQSENNYPFKRTELEPI